MQFAATPMPSDMSGADGFAECFAACFKGDAQPCAAGQEPPLPGPPDEAREEPDLPVPDASPDRGSEGALLDDAQPVLPPITSLMGAVAGPDVPSVPAAVASGATGQAARGESPGASGMHAAPVPTIGPVGVRTGDLIVPSPLAGRTGPHPNAPVATMPQVARAEPVAPVAPPPVLPAIRIPAMPTSLTVAPSDEPGLAASPPVSGSGSTARVAPVGALPDGPAQVVVRQVAQAVRPGGGAVIDIALDPVELGRVQMRLSPEEDGLRVLVIAERAETGELLRRHASLLERALRDLGHAAVTVDIGGQAATGDGAGQRNASGPAQPVAASAAPPGTDSPTTFLPLSARGALDLRL